MNCINCEHFKVLYPPMGKYESGRAACKKYDLIVDFLSRRKLNRLTCVEEGETNA